MTRKRLPDDCDNRESVRVLLANIKAKRWKLKKLLTRCRSHWGYEDIVYRFYHGSFKVYAIQNTTTDIVTALQALAPETPLDKAFMQIVSEGTGKRWVREHNQHWDEVTRPMLEAFFHARYFLEMVVKYGRELEYPPCLLPSGWASVLSLYHMR